MRVVVLVVRTLWRYFVTGQSVLGRAADNATFLQAASRDYRDKPVEKLSGPIWQRLTRRWAVLGVPLTFMALSVAARVVADMSAVDPAWTRLQWLHMAYRWWVVLGLGSLAYGTWQGVQYLRHRKVDSEFLYPTWQAACGVLGLPYHRRDARHNVFLPDEFEELAGEFLGPTRHHWLARWSGVARLSDWRVDRKLARELAQLAEEQEQREADYDAAAAADEPASVPSTELVVRDKPRWPVYPRRAVRAAPAAVSEETPDPPVRIMLPPGKCGSDAQKKAFTNAVGPVLGWPEPKAEWYLSGRHPYVELRPTRPPPPELSFDDVKRYLEASKLARPFLGLAAGNRPIYLDLDNESPHILLSGGTGTGKSTLLKTPLSERMHCGTGSVFLDFKRVSHLWAHNLPGCVYAWKIAAIHNVSVALGDELMRRIEDVLPDDYDTETDLVKFQEWDIVVEEINSLTPMLQKYWQRIRSPQDPVPSPALTAIQQIIFMGRQMGMHVWIGSQRAAANVFGGDGGSTRENFASRLMAKWTKQTWAMLAGGIPFLKCPGGGRGIWTLVQNDEAVIIRVPNITDAEARARAMSGVPSPPTPLNADLAGGPIVSGPVVPAGVSAPELVTLSKAVEHLSMTLPALRQAAHREAADKGGSFPASSGEVGAAKTYYLEELIAWKRAKTKDEATQLEEAWELPEPRREGWVYRFDVLDPETGAQVCGYVGQTGWINDREAQHRHDKPWADLIIGSIQPIEHFPACTQQELDDAELHYIHTLMPQYNIQGNEDNPNAVPKWEQVDQRQARNAAKGLPAWVPRDLYNERKAAVI